ncbi:probable inactive dual specificity protein phosphatase-like At4g18593 [Camellia sinensis]|uniref:probable inactive dual specificity protein phosphatase-like At4g18593 n=1 Tax=Camellia sinensis TaxID=4442 RepID=UPI0010365695|nr:probable inactive dual specificity protein phosphatase-like At4g18593 [Camellia sinensis]
MIGDSYNRREGIDTSKFGVDPSLPTEEASPDVDISGNSERVSGRAYRCKKCQRVVALQENIVDHVPGEGETSFGWHKRKGDNPFNKCDEVECTSIFVEPLRWMTTAFDSCYPLAPVEEGALEGKLSCVHCEACLGYFNWSGIQCSCGGWITPAFQLHKRLVDISTV